MRLTGTGGCRLGLARAQHAVSIRQLKHTPRKSENMFGDPIQSKCRLMHGLLWLDLLDVLHPQRLLDQPQIVQTNEDAGSLAGDIYTYRLH